MSLTLSRLLSLLGPLLTACSAAIVPAHATGNATWPYHTYKTVKFTPPWLNITNHYRPAEGHILIAPDGATAFELSPVIMEMSGELVWNGPLTQAFGFGVQKYLGEDVLVYWSGTPFPEPVGRGSGSIYLFNSSYEPIANVSLAGNWVALTPNATYPSYIDLHEMYLTDHGSVLVTANNVTRTDLTSVGGPSDGWIVNCFVFEIDFATNEVLFEWNSLDHLGQIPLNASQYPLGSEGFNGTAQTNAWGYFHINAVTPFEDGYLLSSRYYCSFMAIGRDGNVTWQLQGRSGGDFTLGPGVDFCYQHDVRVESGRGRHNNDTEVILTFHDNHNCPIDNNKIPSSGKRVLVDLCNMEVTLLQRYLNKPDPIFAQAMGSYQRLADGNVFVGHGEIPIAEEFSPDGLPLSTIQYGHAMPKKGGGFVSTDSDTLSYRSYK